MEYTDLDLNKMIAELEGWEYDHLTPLFKGKPDTSHQMYKAKSKLFDLMVKYKVNINRYYEYVAIDDNGDEGYQTTFKSESEIPRAIIICILKSKNII